MFKFRWYQCDRIANLRQLLERSSRLYGRRSAFEYRLPDGSVECKNYEELRNDVNALGTALLSRGLKGCHIALIGENSYEWVVTYLAVVNGLGVVVPVDKELTDENIFSVLRLSDVNAIVCSQTFVKVFEQSAPFLNDITHFISISGGSSAGRFLSFDELIKEGRRLMAEGNRDYLDCPVDSGTLCEILSTSGTMGKSKAVMLCQRNIVSVILSTVMVVKLKKRVLSVLPMYHTYECSLGILTAIYGGVTICINNSLKYLEKNLKFFKPSMLVLVPLFVESFYKKIMDDLKMSGRLGTVEHLIAFSNRLLRLGIDLRGVLFKPIRNAFGGRLRLISCGGAPLRADLVERFREFGIEILNGYGITECAPLVSASRDSNHNNQSVGIVIPCCQVKIDSPDANGEGEILVRGDNVMLGYYKDEAETVLAFDDGWFKTGDLGSLDKDGYLYITGRKKNTIILSNGKNVQPEEIEECLKTRIPYIKDVIVFAAGKAGECERISAIVVPDMEYFRNHGISDIGGLLETDVRSVNRVLPSFKQVSRVHIREKDFEMTSTKKIKRFTIMGDELKYVGEN